MRHAFARALVQKKRIQRLRHLLRKSVVFHRRREQRILQVKKDLKEAQKQLAHLLPELIIAEAILIRLGLRDSFQQQVQQLRADEAVQELSLIHISEPTRLDVI
eukprot:10777222-Prorocentrum_lima.AAC.1